MSQVSAIERYATIVLGVGVAVLAGLSVWKVVDKPRDDGPVFATTPTGFVENWDRDLPPTRAIGDPDAPIQLVEFLDLECPACRRGHEVLDEVGRIYGRRLSLRLIHFPLSQHRHAVSAARGAVCAGESGVNLRFIQVALRDQDLFGKRPWGAFAADAGVADTVEFLACMSDSMSLRAVERDRRIGESLGVTSTPTILVNGWRFSAAATVESLVAFIDSAGFAQRKGDARASTTSEATSSPSVDHRQNELRSFFEVGRATGSLSYSARQLSLVPRARLHSAPLWSTDARTTDPAFDLSQLHEAVLLPTGAVVALSRIGSQVVWFSSDERVARVVGRVGGGPGEFRSPTGLVVHEDSVGVLDPANGRVQWVDAEGSPRAAQRIKGLVGGVTGIAGVLRGGRVVLHGTGRVPSIMPTRRRSDAAVWIGSDTVELAQIATIPDVRLVERAVGALGRRDVFVDHVRLAPKAHVVALEAHLVVASDSAFRLQLLGDRGIEKMRLAVEWPLPPITTDMRRAHADDEFQRRLSMKRETPVDEAALRRSVDEATYATISSPIRALHLAPGGDFWVVATPAAADVRGEALRFSREGELRSRLQWQHTGEPIAFGTDRVLFTHRRADGHVVLRAYAIVPGT